MPSRKGKGRQCGGFDSKSQRAQFQKEWQAKLQKVQSKCRQQQRQLQKERQRNQLVTKSSSGAGRQTFTSQLRRMIAERQHFDQLEDRTQVYRGAAQARQKHAQTNGALAVSPPGWILFHRFNDETDDEDFGKDFRRPLSSDTLSTRVHLESGGKLRVPSLQSLCLEAFAAVIPEYYDALGEDVLHGYLSLLPGPALSVLSVLVSQQANKMTNGLVKVIGQHTHVTRLAIVAPRHCDETDPQWKALEPSAALPPLLPAFGTGQSQSILWNTIDHGDAESCHLVVAGEELQQPQQESSRQSIMIPMQQVPDSWESLASDSDDDECPATAGPLGYSYKGTYSTLPVEPYMVLTGCLALERLELGHFPTLTFDLVEQLLSAWGETLTHLGLSGSLSWEDGAEVLWKLPLWLPHLRLLDVSGNGSWVTEPLLRHLYEAYNLRDDSANYWHSYSDDEKGVVTMNPDASNDDAVSFLKDPASGDLQDGHCSSSTSPLTPARQSRRPRRCPLVIKATGSLSRSSQILLEMEFGTVF